MLLGNLLTLKKNTVKSSANFCLLYSHLFDFRRLIIGTSCDVFTDHKPIIALLDKKIDNVPLRIQKWIMHIQAFDVKIKHIAGQDNLIADALSRNPVTETDEFNIEPEENTEYTLCLILKSLPIDLQTFAKATANSTVLQKVIQAINTSWTLPAAKLILQYYHFRNQLFIKQCSTHRILDIWKQNSVVLLIKEGRLLIVV